MISLYPTSVSVPQHPRTLIADDEPDILTALRLLLKSDGYEPETVSSPAAVLEAIERSEFDVVLIDLNYARDTTSGREGIDLISRVHALDPALPIVVMTGWATVDLAVEAMRRGVRDFVQKPWDNSRLLQTLHKQVRHARARRNVQQRVAATRKTEAQFKRELIEARELQENLLANTTSKIAGLDVAAKWQPATTVGGDYIARNLDLLSIEGRLVQIAFLKSPKAEIATGPRPVANMWCAHTPHPRNPIAIPENTTTA